MAGGIGSRFWPMSQADNPKQFIDIMGIGQSMLQTTFHRFEEICPRENIFIVTGREWVRHVHEQIPGLNRWQVLSEPFRRNTAPCIAYAAAIINTFNPEANIIVSPSDHVIFGDSSFKSDMAKALQIAGGRQWIVTLGVKPTNPAISYGYIQFDMDDNRQRGLDGYGLPEKIEDLYRVRTFTEKPPREIAETFIESGEYYWNTGIYVWSLPVLKAAYRQYLPGLATFFSKVTLDTPDSEVERIYTLSEAISVDVGIMEKAGNVCGFLASFRWSDVETWETLYNTCSPNEAGNRIVGDNVFTYDVKDTIVHVPDGLTIVLEGLEGYIVAGDRNTLLICRRDAEDRIVKFVSDVELAQVSPRKHKNKQEK